MNKAGAYGSYLYDEKRQYHEQCMEEIEAFACEQKIPMAMLQYGALVVSPLRGYGLPVAFAHGIRNISGINETWRPQDLSNITRKVMAWGDGVSFKGYRCAIEVAAQERARSVGPWHVLNADFCGSVTRNTIVKWVRDTVSTGALASASLLGVSFFSSREQGESERDIHLVTRKYSFGCLSGANIGRLRLIADAIEESGRYRIKPRSEILFWRRHGVYSHMVWAFFELRGCL